MLSKLSKELQDQYTPPRPNEVRVYRLDGIRKKKVKEGVSSFTVPNSRQLPTSYVILDKGVHKTVALTTRLKPTKDPNVQQRVVEPVEFRMDSVGEIRITPENYPKFANTDKFLFFSPWIMKTYDENDNDLRPWQVKDLLGSFIHLVDKQAEARKLIEAEDAVFDARTAINAMTEKDMDITVLQLKLGMPQYLTYEEKKAALIKSAKSNTRSAKRISSMQSEEDMVLRRWINGVKEEGIIKITKSEKEFIWTEGLESIVKKMPGKTLEDSFLFYLKTEAGGEVKTLIDLTLEAKQTKGKKKPEDKAVKI
jgi:hypothetical protein